MKSVIARPVYTHAGMFHADEVMAIALLQLYLPGEIRIVRTFQLPEDQVLFDTHALVLDTGRKFDGDTFFDHHQNPDSSATNILIADYLLHIGALPQHHYDWMLPALTRISDIDRGLTKAETPLEFNGIIRSFNGLELPGDEEDQLVDFELAIHVASFTIMAMGQQADRALADKQTWESLPVQETTQGKFKVSSSNDIILTWKSLAAWDGINGLICPNDRTAGAWQVISRDSNEWQVPTDSLQTFRHPSGFMAVYPDYSSLMIALGSGQYAMAAEN
jgi:uncharacterized UPF0160 family protein